MRAVGLALMACRLGLMTCATVGSWQIRSKFVIEQGDDKIIDVTLRTGDPRSGCEGCFGSVSLTVLDARTGAPTVFLKLADVASGSGSDGSFGTGPPAVLRRGSGYRLIQKTVKRWKPCLATELDRFLGEGAVRDRMLLVELPDVDDAKEMPGVMNLYRISAATALISASAPSSTRVSDGRGVSGLNASLRAAAVRSGGSGSGGSFNTSASDALERSQGRRQPQRRAPLATSVRTSGVHSRRSLSLRPRVAPMRSSGGEDSRSLNVRPPTASMRSSGGGNDFSIEPRQLCSHVTVTRDPLRARYEALHGLVSRGPWRAPCASLSMGALVSNPSRDGEPSTGTGCKCSVHPQWTLRYLPPRGSLNENTTYPHTHTCARPARRPSRGLLDYGSHAKRRARAIGSGTGSPSPAGSHLRCSTARSPRGHCTPP